MDQKIENLLNISLQSTGVERAKSLDLGVAQNDANGQWEIIVKHTQSLDFLINKYPETTVEELIGGYAIVVTDKDFIDQIAAESVVDYVEMPKSLYFGLQYSKTASCISDAGVAGYRAGTLSGNGVIVAIIDSDIDILNGEFRKSDGTTRFLNVWNQESGIEYDRKAIDEAITNNESVAYGSGGHGTNVAAIACGNSGVAYEADIIGVQLSRGRRNSFPRTTEIMRGLNYVVKKAMEYGKPVAINISIGNNYGPHDGTGILENFIDEVSNVWKSVICIGSGNEASRGIHTTGVVNSNQIKVVQLAVGDFETSINIQIWKEYADDYAVEIISPSGKVIGPVTQNNTVTRFVSQNTQILGFVGEPGPYGKAQEIYFELLPEDTYIDGGLWQIRLIGGRVVNGRYHMWLPSSVVLNDNTRFLDNSEELTITIPALARRAISVGAYDPRSNAYSDFSGRGGEFFGNVVKPELLAPGYRVVLFTGRPEERVVTGTSFATPFVTGAAACLMQWGIVDGNDPYLYGEKVKAYLIKGARQFPGVETNPNAVTGWGALCLSDSIPDEMV